MDALPRGAGLGSLFTCFQGCSQFQTSFTNTTIAFRYGYPYVYVCVGLYQETICLLSTAQI